MGAAAKTATANSGSRGAQPPQQDGSGDSRKFLARPAVAIQPAISTVAPSAWSARVVARSGQRSCVTRLFRPCSRSRTARCWAAIPVCTRLAPAGPALAGPALAGPTLAGPTLAGEAPRDVRCHDLSQPVLRHLAQGAGGDPRDRGGAARRRIPQGPAEPGGADIAAQPHGH